MNKNRLLSLILACVAVCVCMPGFAANKKEKKFIAENVSYAAQQTEVMLKNTGAATGKNYPRTLNRRGELATTGMYDWTPGFFPGSLWYLYELTGQPQPWEERAIQWTETLEPLQTFTGHHDLGFMMYCSYGNAQRLHPSEKYQKILVRSAESLASRFSPKTGTIKSWNSRKAWDDKTEWFYPVIIDNMMNLELLMYAYKVTGNERFRDIAVTHANTTLKNHFRPDWSSYHVINYDTLSGAVLDKATCQGYSDNSTWARGQAWGIYGYTMMYRETGIKEYLDAAVKMTDWYLNHPNLPKDMIPLWDFDVDEEGFDPEGKSYAVEYKAKLRDASAAAIVCSALFELSGQSGRKDFRKAAITMLHSLASPAYRAPVGENGGFLIMHCVGSLPHRSELDVPLVYADYYFLEALERYRKSL